LFCFFFFFACFLYLFSSASDQSSRLYNGRVVRILNITSIVAILLNTSSVYTPCIGYRCSNRVDRLHMKNTHTRGGDAVNSHVQYTLY
jgi:hypothetical protein